MSFVQLSNVCLSFADRNILKDVNLVLAAGTKAALTGANGSGKSTLMKIIAGLIKQDSGEISKEKDTIISYLPQSGIVHSGETLYAESEKAFSNVQKLIEELDKIGKQMQETKNETEQMRLSKVFYSLQVKINESKWYRRETLIKEVLFGLGFALHDLTRLTDEFSGGWQMRIALAKVLLQGADILVLDEPTNYLDLEARNWLENYLKNFSGGFLLVSHDRYFLDTCVNETYELFNGALTRYIGTYSNYEKQRKQELQKILKDYNEQQAEIQKTEDFIRKFRYNKSKAAMVQDRIRRLEKMPRIEIPAQFKKIKFQFPSAPHSGKIVLKLKNISKSFDKKKVIEDFNFILEKNERLVLLGKNGAGKSTLLRIMAGADNNFQGTRTYGAGVNIGYFSQNSAEVLNGPERVIDLVESEAPLDLVPNLRNMLAGFLFRGDDIYKSISVLSGGEKSRLSLLRLLLKNHNLLILDEPTNHLDMHSQDALLEALKDFGGTVIFVSHDKGFIKNLATNVLELSPPDAKNFLDASTIKNYPGTYDYYLYTSQNTKKTEKQTANNSEPVKDKMPKKKFSYEKQKSLRSKRQKLEKKEKTLLTQIEKIEEKLKEAQNDFAKPEVYSNPKKSKTLAEKIKNLELQHKIFLKNWEEVSEKLIEF